MRDLGHLWVYGTHPARRLEMNCCEQILEADAVLALITPAALNSSWMLTELGMAEGFDRPILPVTLGVKPDDLPAPLRSFQAIPFDRVNDALSRLYGERKTGCE